MITTLSNIPYSQRKREAAAKAVPRLAINAVDGYVAAATLQGFGGQAAAGTFSVLSGGLAAFHVGSGIRFMMKASDSRDEVDKKRLQTMAIGEVLTGVGFAGMAFGLGLWAIPVVALGEITTNFARFT
ncbi:MAG: hypothetical protein AMXMBFR33_10150 [Candidatus Xenobia bacterium]|jgi:hypothetical protein